MFKNVISVPVADKRRSSSNDSHVRRSVSLDVASIGDSSDINSIVTIPASTTVVAINPIRQLQLDTLELCGLTHDRAFAIDNSRIGIDVGEYTITKLMEVFFIMVYEDTEDWFSSPFKRIQQDVMMQNLTDYLLQRTGGPCYYTLNKRGGFPSLLYRHNHLKLTARHAERWLHHFESAFDVIDHESDCNVPPQYRRELCDHMRYTAYYLVAGRIQQERDGQQGVQIFDYS